MAWDDGMTHSLCGVAGCQQCHCHGCATADPSVAVSALQEQVVRLEKRAAHWARMTALCEKRHDHLYRKLAAAREERDRLRLALRQHGAHDVTCRFDGITCRCGFSAALEGEPPPG
jgi:rubrerythrin